MTITELTLEQLAERHLQLPGTFNVRDIGGYPASDGRTTKWRTLVRADALHRLDDVGRSTLDEIGIRLVIDLREDEEVENAPNQLDGLDIRHIRLPLYDRATSGIVSSRAAGRELASVYAILREQRAEALTAVVRELAAEGGLPALIHCTAGKDRTGMVIALVLSAIGVADEFIAADFAATGTLLDGAFRDEIVAKSRLSGLSPEAVLPYLSADPELILTFLEGVRATSGDIPSFLQTHGMTDEELHELREHLLTSEQANEEPVNV